MKTTRTRNLFAAALSCVLVSTSAFAQGLPTTGPVESPLGKLEIKNGYALFFLTDSVYSVGFLPQQRQPM